MSTLIFPDINVWLAVLLADHTHRETVKEWWQNDSSSVLAFTRITQMGVLRLLTTAAVMNGNPLTMTQAWSSYDRLFTDERVAFFDEPRGVELLFRDLTLNYKPSPKLWADAWLAAVASQSGGSIVTLDKALAKLSSGALLLT